MVPPARVADVRAAVARAKAGEPLAAVTVVPPAAMAGRSLRRALASACGGLVNVAWRSLVELAAVLVPASPLGTRPLPRAGRWRAVADVVGAGSGMGGHRATVRAYDAAFRELRGCSPGAVAAVAGGGGGDVVARFEGFRRVVAGGGWHDEVDVLLAAAAVLAADADAGAGAAGHVVLYQPPPLSWAEQQFVDALARAGRVTIVGSGGAGVGAAELPAPTKVVLAPDPEAEVRLAIGEVARLAGGGAGIPHERIALVHAGDEPYPRVAAELLDAAGVPWQGTRPETLADSLAGRVLLGLLRLPGDAWSRSSVMAVLADAAPVAAPVLASWEAAARSAQVVGGMQGWRPRLERWAGAQATSGFSGSAERAAAALALADEVDALVAAVAPGPPAPSWNAFVTWALALSRWMPEDERVGAAVASLAALDGVAATPTIASFADAVAAQLEHVDTPGDASAGVLVGALGDVAGADVDAVVVLGVNEGRLPSRHADDPLLPDRLRALTQGELPTRRERRAREQQLVARLLAGARERVLCASRADQRAQREQLPSRWVTMSAAAQCLDVPSFAAAVLTRPAASNQEATLQALAAGAPVAAYGIERGVAAVAARASSAVTEWDGGVGPHPALGLRGGRTTAAAFERWATCPFSHFLRSVLRVQETVRPEERAGVDPMARGALVHAVLRVLDRARVDGDDTASPERATEEACAAFEASGQARPGLAWLLEQRTLAAALATVTALDEAERGASGFRTVDADVAFDGVPIGGRSGVRFSGHADRVDIDGAGTRRVLDYRSGRSDRARSERVRAEADPTVAGTRLQLPVAALALGASVAEQWYVTDAARGHPRLRLDVDDGGTVAARVAEVVDLVADGIEAGAFPANPGDAVLDSWANCRRCPYDRVCPAERGDASERKQHDPAVARLGVLAP